MRERYAKGLHVTILYIYDPQDCSDTQIIRADYLCVPYPIQTHGAHGNSIFKHMANKC